MVVAHVGSQPFLYLDDSATIQMHQNEKMEESKKRKFQSPLTNDTSKRVKRTVRCSWQAWDIICRKLGQIEPGEDDKSLIDIVQGARGRPPLGLEEHKKQRLLPPRVVNIKGKRDAQVQ